jgi:very-short-patch-repair endonuclease
VRGARLGASFKRQVVLGRFIVDFVAPKARLIVEIDGAQHLRTADASRDERRDRWLKAQGYRVLRISAEMVRTDPELVSRLVQEALE